MKMKTVWFITILLIVATICINMSLGDKEKSEFKPLELNVGDEFNKIEYQNQMYVINYKIGDVTGDGENDMIILIGEKDETNKMKSNKVDVVVYDTANKTFTKASLKNFSGQNSKILLNDLTGDEKMEVIIILENDDKTKNIRVVEVREDTLKDIWGQRDNRGIIFVGEIIDGVKAHLRCGKVAKELYLDLSDKKSDYIASKKIDESGKIICENKKVTTTGFTSVEIVKLSDKSGIQTTQRICAFEDNDILDEVTVIWRFENGKWKMAEAEGVRVGNLIY